MNKVTVLIPTFNHGHVLPHQVDSILTQTSPPGRLVIYDDGSTDDTPAVLAKYERHPLVTIIRQKKNTGVHAATVRLLSEVRTEYFAFAAADDVVSKDWCATMAALLDTHPRAKMAVSNTYILDGGRLSFSDSIRSLNGDVNGLYEPEDYVKALLKHGRLPPSNTVLYRSDIIESIVRPVLARRDLLSLVDVLLILAIASKHPIAYTLKATGLVVKHGESYGHSFFDRIHLQRLLASVDRFAVDDDFIPLASLRGFLIEYTKYSWTKQMVLTKLAANRSDNRGTEYAWRLASCYWELFVAFVRSRRFRFVRLHKLYKSRADSRLEAAVDGRLKERARYV